MWQKKEKRKKPQEDRIRCKSNCQARTKVAGCADRQVRHVKTSKGQMRRVFFYLNPAPTRKYSFPVASLSLLLAAFLAKTDVA